MKQEADELKEITIEPDNTKASVEEMRDFERINDMWNRLTPDAQRLALTNFYQVCEVLNDEEDGEEMKRILRKFNKTPS